MPSQTFEDRAPAGNFQPLELAAREISNDWKFADCKFPVIGNSRFRISYFGFQNLDSEFQGCDFAAQLR